MTSPIPSAAIGATAPTSRETFRLLAKCLEATNREADTLRKALLSQWRDGDGAEVLVERLEALDESDPEGAEGVESRLAAWFSFAGPHEGPLVTKDDSVLTGLSDELRSTLAGIARTEQE